MWWPSAASCGNSSKSCDNVSVVYMTANPIHHHRTKHMEINIHFVREKVALGQVCVHHLPSAHQFADIMTKGLPVQLFSDFLSSLCIRDPPATTAGGVLGLLYT
jgi:hypothetical protein